MDRLNRHRIFLFFVFLIVTGCGNSQNQLDNEGTKATQIQSGYPVTGNEAHLPTLDLPGYTPPKTTLSPALIAKLEVPDPPNPDKSLGSLSGLILDSNNNFQINNMNICLYHSTGIEEAKFPPFIVGCNSKNGDIMGKTDADGYFVFKNVPPGIYFLIVSIDQSPIFQSQDASQPYMIKVDSDAIINLGIVYYTSR